MSKTKMRCNTCGKWFQSANAKDMTCPDCTQKARKEKLAAKTAPPPTNRIGQGTETRSVPPPPKPKPAAGGTSHWLDAQNDVKVGQPDQPTKPKIPSSPAPRDNRGDRERGGYQSTGPGGYRDRDERGTGPGAYRDRGPGGYRETDYRSPGGYRESNYRGSAPYRVGGGMGIPDTVEQRPRQPMTGPGGPNRGPRPGGPGEPRPDKFRGGKPGGPKQKTPKPKPETPPKPKREKIPPPEPFKPTEEQIAQVEARYQELAVPTEFDGIRTQISKELSIPKTAVKKIIKDFRQKQDIPSWWDLQTYKGDEEEKAKIKAAYEPHLPLPPVGIHKQIAEALELKPGDVYQAIKAIRLEMNLPQYNDPALHGLELKPRKKDQSETETPEAKQETETRPDAEKQPETESQQQPEVKQDIEPQQEPEIKQDIEPQQEPEVKQPDTESQQQPEIKQDIEPQQEPEIKQDTEPQQKLEKQPENASQQQPEQETTESSEVEKQSPDGTISSIETDIALHKESDTIEADAPPEKQNAITENPASPTTET